MGGRKNEPLTVHFGSSDSLTLRKKVPKPLVKPSETFSLLLVPQNLAVINLLFELV